MNNADTRLGPFARRMRILRFVLTMACFAVFTTAGPAWSQDAGPDAPPRDAAPAAGADDPVQKAEAALAAEEPEPDEQDAGTALLEQPMPKVNLLTLMVKGGWLMLPIAFMSLLVVAFGLERLLALRRRKVLPLELIKGLGKLTGEKGGLDPRKAYKLCQRHPSAAASVIRAMLLKVGRPHGELEHAVSEASDREAARLYSNVRWLTLAAGLTPLMGLLGTVWGMINAFFTTANLPIGANKAQALADGIWVALVTTFAGLAVAIPAAFLAHLFEGRVQQLFRELDETLLGLLPQLERFEGRLRVRRDHYDASSGKADGKEAGQTQPVATPK